MQRNTSDRGPNPTACAGRAAAALLACLVMAGAACHVEPAGSEGAVGGAVAGANGSGTGGTPTGSGGTPAATGGVPAATGGVTGSGGKSPGSGGTGAGGAGPGGASTGAGGDVVGEGGRVGATGGSGSGTGGAAMGSGGKTATGGASGPGGGAGGARATGGAGGATATGGNNGVIAVGYGGIRIASHDLGMTWQDESHWAQSGGDDNDLLRSIAYGNGIWIAGGWRYVTSADGIKWTDRGMAVDVISAVRCNIIESIAFGQGRFVGACGDNLVWSTDGLAWKKLGPTPNIEKHPWIVFDPGTSRFAVTGDNSKSFVSSDMGMTWTELTDVVAVRLCKGGLNPTSTCPGFFADGVFLRGQWPAQVQRSTNGTSWSKSVGLPAGDSVFTDYSFAVGPVGP